MASSIEQVERLPPPCCRPRPGAAGGTRRFGSQELAVSGCVLLGPDGAETDALPSGAPLTVALRLERLVPGEYQLAVGAYPADWEYAYDYRWAVRTLRVTGPPGGQGVLSTAHRWRAHQPERAAA